MEGEIRLRCIQAAIGSHIGRNIYAMPVQERELGRVASLLTQRVEADERSRWHNNKGRKHPSPTTHPPPSPIHPNTASNARSARRVTDEKLPHEAPQSAEQTRQCRDAQSCIQSEAERSERRPSVLSPAFGWSPLRDVVVADVDGQRLLDRDARVLIH